MKAALVIVILSISISFVMSADCPPNTTLCPGFQIACCPNSVSKCCGDGIVFVLH